MPDRYVRSTDGNNADDGSTWALAKADGAGAAAIDAAGDRIFFSQAHAESTAAGITWAWAGTLTSPTFLIGGNDAAEPPTAVSTAPTVTTTGASAITLTGCLYSYGINYTVGSGATGANMVLGSASVPQVFDKGSIILGTTSIAARIQNNSNNAVVEFRNVDFKFNNASQGFSYTSSGGGRFNFAGGSILAGGSALTRLIDFTGPGQTARIDGMDLSNGAAAMNLCSTTQTHCRLIARDVKLPASWSGSVNGSTPGMGSRFELYNGDDADTNYKLEVKDYVGTITDETTIVRSGGASDGTTALAWKMASNANALFPLSPLRSPEIVIWNETVGSAITVTVEIVHDSQGSGTASAFTDREIYLEAMYLGTSGRPLGTFINDAAADVLATAADQTSSSETWTTTGLTTPVKQKLSVTFTPQEKGYIHLAACLTVASKTAYVCPKVTVS